MDMKSRLNSINRLLADVYEQDIRISTLLTEYLNTEQLEYLKTEKLGDFLDFMLFGIRCRFAAITDGMRLYSILSARYGLEDSTPHALAQIGEAEGVTRERIRQLEYKALHKLKPTNRYDIPKQLSCLAAREVLGIIELPPQPRYLTKRPEIPPSEITQAQAFKNLSDIVSEEAKERGNTSSNRGMPWTPELDEQLKQRFFKGISQSKLAQEMGRSVGGIRARLKKHGLIDDEKEKSHT